MNPQLQETLLKKIVLIQKKYLKTLLENWRSIVYLNEASAQQVEKWDSTLTKITVWTNVGDNQNAVDLAHLFCNLVPEMLLCGGLSSRDVIPQGVRDSTGEIFRRNVGFPGGHFVSRVWRNVVLAAVSPGKLLQLKLRKMFCFVALSN